MYNTDICTIGNWMPDIRQALDDRGVPVEQHAVKDSLFTCVGDYQIELNRVCPGACVDSAPGASDTCRDPSYGSGEDDGGWLT